MLFSKVIRTLLILMAIWFCGKPIFAQGPELEEARRFLDTGLKLHNEYLIQFDRAMSLAFSNDASMFHPSNDTWIISAMDKRRAWILRFPEAPTLNLCMGARSMSCGAERMHLVSISSNKRFFGIRICSDSSEQCTLEVYDRILYQVVSKTFTPLYVSQYQEPTFWMVYDNSGNGFSVLSDVHEGLKKNQSGVILTYEAYVCKKSCVPKGKFKKNFKNDHLL